MTPPANRSPGDLLREILRTLGAYVSGQIRVALILTVIYCLGFAIAGLPGWPVVALLCGLFNLVPVLGSVIALLLSLGIAFFAELEMNRILIVLGTFIFAQALEGFYLTPKILGNRLRMPAWSVFVAILAGSWILGPIGFLIAVPLVAVLLVIWRFVRRQE